MAILCKKNIETILALTPMQEGMLYHYLKDPRGQHYFGQLILDLTGEIEPRLFEQAWNLVVQSNEMLRTVFSWKKLKSPVQIVLKSHQIKVRNYDLTASYHQEKDQLVRRIIIKDRSKIFDLQQVPFRVTLLQTSDAQYRLIVSSHHILYDGWSSVNIVKGLVRAYESSRLRSRIPPLPVPSYRHYIHWLSKQDKHEGLCYWESYLEGYNRRATLPAVHSGSKKGEYAREAYEFIIDESLSGGIRHIAGHHQVSANTIFQTLWGLLLHRYNNTDDVVFGAVVAGRPTEIKDVNRMVGLFINTLPVRIKIGKTYLFSQLLQKVHQNMMHSIPYEYVPLADMQARSLLKENLIHHIMSYQNYPLKKELFSFDEETSFRVENVESLEQTNYDFNFVIFPGQCFTAKLLFNALTYSLESITKIATHFNLILKQVVENPDIDTRKIEIIARNLDYPGDSFLKDKVQEPVCNEKIAAEFDF
jgi:hypothetical protein